MVGVLALEIFLAALLVTGVGLFWLKNGAIPKWLILCLPSWFTIFLGAFLLQFLQIINFNHLAIWESTLPPNTLGTLWVLLEAGIWLTPLFALLDLVLTAESSGWTKHIPLVNLSNVWVVVFLAAFGATWFLQLYATKVQGFLLASAVFLVGILALWMEWSTGRNPNFRRVALGWSLIWVLCGLGYLLAGRWGILFLSFPAMAMGLMSAYCFSSLALPLSSSEETKAEETKPEKRWLALRCALTYALGTNYPYYVIRDWKNSSNANETIPKPRAPGNPFLQFFAGPGIVLTDCAHAAVLNDGFAYRVAHPGLTFTNIYEQLFAAVDLRPQLRVTTIPAETQDGILTKTLVFMPHRIDTGGKEASLGNSLPYYGQALLKAVTQNIYVEHDWRRDETGKGIETIKRVPWDELVLMEGPAIFKNIVVGYTCNELHETQDGKRDPRAEIGQAFRNQLKSRMSKFGIEMVGGGLSNIVPERSVVEQRIANWSAKWKKRIEEEIGQAEAEITLGMEPIWAEAQLSIYQDLADILQKTGTLSDEIIAFQLVEALGAIPPREATEQPEKGLSEFIRALMRRSK